LRLCLFFFLHESQALIGNLLQAFCRRRFRIRNHIRFAGIAVYHNLGIYGNAAQKRNIQFLGSQLAPTFFKQIDFLAAVGTGKTTHVFNDANLKIAAKRIVWAKFLNGGQTCVAPDYILAEKGVKEKLIAAIKNQILEIHGDDPQKSEAFVRIINPRHYNRIMQLIDKEKIVIGGESDEADLYISPTVMDNVTFDDAVMQEEIFGPVLPIIEFDKLDWAIKMVKDRPKPLALYVFTSHNKIRDKIFYEISFGGGAVNDAVMHLANSNLPFGGVGNSGMGSYHGKAGFDAFSHYKSILDKSTLIEPPIKYPPYVKWKRKLLKNLLE